MALPLYEEQSSHVENKYQCRIFLFWLRARGVQWGSDSNPLIAVFRPGTSPLHVKAATANDELMTQRWQVAFVNPISSSGYGCLVIRLIKPHVRHEWVAHCLPLTSSRWLKGKSCIRVNVTQTFCQVGCVSRTSCLSNVFYQIPENKRTGCSLANKSIYVLQFWREEVQQDFRRQQKLWNAHFSAQISADY